MSPKKLEVKDSDHDLSLSRSVWMYSIDGQEFHYPITGLAYLLKQKLPDCTQDIEVLHEAWEVLNESARAAKAGILAKAVIENYLYRVLKAAFFPRQPASTVWGSARDRWKALMGNDHFQYVGVSGPGIPYVEHALESMATSIKSQACHRCFHLWNMVNPADGHFYWEGKRYKGQWQDMSRMYVCDACKPIVEEELFRLDNKEVKVLHYMLTSGDSFFMRPEFKLTPPVVKRAASVQHTSPTLPPWRPYSSNSGLAREWGVASSFKFNKRRVADNAVSH